MKLDLLRKFAVALLLIFWLFVSIPFDLPIVIANTLPDYDFEINKQISPDQINWYDYLGEVTVNTPLYFQVTINMNTYTGYDFLFFLDDSMGFTVETRVIDTLSINYGPYLANLGSQTNVVTGTNVFAGITHSDTVSYIGISSQPVPEPATILLLGSGLIGLGGYGRKRFLKK